MRLPSVHFADQGSFIRQPSVEALTAKGGDFNFGHVQPNGMLGGVMEFDAPQELRGMTFPEYLLEHLAKVSVEVVQDQMNPACFGIHLLQQVADECNEIDFGAPRRHHYRSPPNTRFDRHEQIAGPVALVLV